MLFAIQIRRKLIVALNQQLSQEAAIVAKGIVLGVKPRYDSAISEAFRKTGTMHILVVSGLHVGLVGTLAFGLLRLFFPHPWRFILAGCASNFGSDKATPCTHRF